VSQQRARRSLLATLARLLRIAAVVLVGGYVTLVFAACAFQRDLQYFPDPVERAPDPAGPPIQVIRLTTSDGQRLVTWWLPPAAGKPVLLFFGGNGDSLYGERGRFDEAGRVGAGLLAVAYEGYSGSTGKPTEDGLHRDAEAAYAWLAARYPAGQIVIEGYSLGTSVAVRLAATHHPARALILEAPFTSAVDVGAARMPLLPVRLFMWDRYESRDWIGQVHMPLLIVHGDADDTVPQPFGRELFALANQPKTFVSLAGANHTDLGLHGLFPQVWRFLGLDSPPPR
jgi:hypothetical protein